MPDEIGGLINDFARPHREMTIWSWVMLELEYRSHSEAQIVCSLNFMEINDYSLYWSQLLIEYMKQNAQTLLTRESWMKCVNELHQECWEKQFCFETHILLAASPRMTRENFLAKKFDYTRSKPLSKFISRPELDFTFHGDDFKQECCKFYKFWRRNVEIEEQRLDA